LLSTNALAARSGTFTQKLIHPQDAYDGFLAVRGYNRDFDLAALDVEDGVRGVALAE
jgi:hypothetical protein